MATLVEARKAAGMSQAAAASAVGLSVRQWQRLEAGAMQPQPRNKAAIEQLIGAVEWSKGKREGKAGRPRGTGRSEAVEESDNADGLPVTAEADPYRIIDPPLPCMAIEESGEQCGEAAIVCTIVAEYDDNKRVIGYSITPICEGHQWLLSPKEELTDWGEEGGEG